MNKQSHNVRNRDLIELKKMKQGLVETTTDKQPESKKLTGWPAVVNFLRYNGICILVAIIILAISIHLIYSRITMKKPDCMVVVNTGAITLQETANDYAKIFTELCPDANGDGAALASVIDCSYDEDATDAQALSAHFMKFQSQFSVEYAQLFILNYDTMARLDNETDGGLWVDDLQLKEYNGKAIKLNGTEFETLYKKQTGGIGFTEDIYLCMRKTGGAIAESKRGKAAATAARQILTELNNQTQN
ncbi:MAG: hypothetical protein IJW78_01425 [Clostridia bacterium]|nr:hypothetical protein [Clostridia bacterium]